MGCGGPTFNIVLDEQKDDDIACNIDDITFIISKDLHDQFGDFIIEGTAENNRGLVLKPVNTSGAEAANYNERCLNLYNLNLNIFLYIKYNLLKSSTKVGLK